MISQAEKERWRERKEAFSREHPTEVELIRHLDELIDRLDSQNPLEATAALEEVSSLLDRYKRRNQTAGARR
jgi:uncharacterized membrane protein YccC